MGKRWLKTAKQTKGGETLMYGQEVVENCCTDKRQRHLCMGKRWLKL